MEKDMEAVDEEGREENIDDTTEQQEEQSPGQNQKRKNNERNVVDCYAEGGEYRIFYGHTFQRV